MKAAHRIMLGVTGHRFLAERERLEAGVREALRWIEERFPGCPLTLLTMLAEGADRLVATQVLSRPGARLVVPLPLPGAEYTRDFATAESKAEFLKLLGDATEVLEMPTAPTREYAYAAAGNYILDHCDVLLAIWDGQIAQGHGGTGEIVARAREKGLPLIWIQAGNRKPGTMEPVSLGGAQGRLTTERFEESPRDEKAR